MKCRILAVLLLASVCFAGAKYYINLNVPHAYDRLGKTADSAFGGPIGIQRFVDTCAAGDTGLINGYGDMRRIQWLSYNLLRNTFARGDTITNLTRFGRAICYQDSATTKMLASVDSGSFVNGDSITNVPTSAGAKLNAVPTYPGITVYKTTATAAAPIRLIGVNASWVNDGTLDTLDFYGVASSTHIKIGKTAQTLSYYYLDNLALYRAAGYNVFNQTLFNGVNWIFNNVKFLGVVDQCVRGCNNPIFNWCEFANAMSAAIYCLLGTWSHCYAHNVTYGFWISSGEINQCVLTGKGGATGIGINNYNSGFQSVFYVTNTVIDSFGIGAYSDYASISNKVTNSKFTNNVTASIKVATGCSVVEGNNLFIGNGNGNAIMLVGTGQSENILPSVYSGTIGYTDKANGDFSPTINATGRRVKTNIGRK